MRPLVSIFSLFALLLFAPTLHAITFVGGFENNTWTDPRNWSPQQIPGAGDLAVIPDDRTAVLFSSVSVDQLILEGGLTNGGGGSLTIVGSFSCTDAGFSAPVTTLNGCAVLWIGGVGVGADFTNYGDVSCNANVSLDYSKIINHGTFDANGTFAMGVIHSPTSFENYGLLRKPLLNGGSVFSMGTLVVNFAGGEIEVKSGELYLSLTSQHYGDVQVDADATLRTHGMEIYNGSTYSGDGTLNMTGNGTFANNTYPVSIDVQNSIVNSNGVFGSGTLIFSKTVDEVNGGFSNTSTFPVGSVLNVNSGTFHGVAGTLNMHGTMNLNQNFTLDGGQLNIFGALNLSGNFSMGVFHASPSVANHGSIVKTGNNIFSMNVGVDNFSDGSIDVQEGTLHISFLKNYNSVVVADEAIFNTHSATFFNGSAISGDGTYQINGNGINADNTSPVSISTAEFLLTNGNFNGTGFIECNSAHVSWLSASLSRTTFGSSTVVDASTAGAHGMNATVTNHGTMNFPVSFGFGNGTLVNHGTVNVSGANSVFLNVGGSIENHGIFRKTAADASIFSVNVQFKNFSGGSILVENGTLRLFGFGEHAGSASISAGAVLEMTGFQIKNGSTIGGAGTWKISNNGLTLVNTLPVTFDIATTNWESGDINGTGEIILSNHLDWTSRNLNAKLTLNGTANLLAPSAKGIGGTLINNGTLTANSTFFGGGTFQNNGTVELNATGNYSTFFKNAGTTNKNITAGDVNFVGNVENSGTLNALDDLLKFEGNFQNSGEIEVAAAATVELAGFSGTTFQAGSQLSGAGTFKINTSILVEADANIEVQNFNLESGSLDGSTTLTFSKNFNWTSGSVAPNLEILPTGVVNILAGGYAFLSGNLDNGGTVECHAPLGFGSTTVVENTGDFKILVEGSFGESFFTGGATFDNSGNFSKNAAGDTYFNVVFNHLVGGSSDVLAGTLWIRNLQNASTANIVSDATLRVQGGNNLAGGSFTGAGTLHFSDFEFHLSNSLTANNLSIVVESNLSGEPGVEFIIGGTAEWRGGEISVPVVVQSSGVFTVTEFGFRQLSAALTNAGMVNVFGFFQPNAGISNSGNFYLDGSNASLYASTQHTFLNTGSLVVRNNFFVSILDMLLQNSGTVESQDGGISIGFGLENSGTFTQTVGSGEVVLYGNSVFEAGSSVALPGVLSLQGSLVLGYPLTFDGEVFNFNGDVLSGQKLTIASEMQWDGGRAEAEILVNSGATLNIGYFGGGGGGSNKNGQTQQPGGGLGKDFLKNFSNEKNRARTAQFVEFQKIENSETTAMQFFGDPTLAANLTNNGTANVTTSLNFDGGFFKNNNFLFCEYGGFYLDGAAANFHNDGDWQVSNYFETDGVACTNNGNLTGDFVDFYFSPDLQNNGTVAPGNSDSPIARFNFDENYDSGAALNLEILSNEGAFGGHDNIFSIGNLSVGGTLNVSEIGTVSDGEFTILACDGGAGCRTGTFSTVNLPANYSISYTSEAVILTKSAVACNLQIAFTVNNATCFGNSNGSVFSTTTGGTAPYTYLWSNGKTTKNINLLAAGDYILTSTDAAGCTASATATVGQPTAISMTVSSTPAGGGKHNVSIVAAGGTPPYNYNRTGLAGWQVSNQFLNLNAGTYIFKTRDANNCQKSKISQVPAPPAPMSKNSAVTKAIDGEPGVENRETAPQKSPLQIFPNPAHDFAFVFFQ